MKKIYIVFLLAALCPFYLLAQTNYKTGYVVTLKGDTVQGLINYKDWNKNPKQISFKNNGGKTTSYSTANTASFSVTGYEYYSRYTGHISEDAEDVSYLSRGLDSTYKVDTVFLRAISRGKNVTLYEYIDIKKVRYFIADKNQPPVELAYHVYLNPNDLSKVDKQRGYIQQLQTLSARYQPENSGLIAQISNADYKDEDLKKVVDKINGSTAGPVEFTARAHSTTRLYVGAAANITQVNFTGQSDFTTKTSYTFPMINVGADIFLNKDVGNLLIRINLGVTRNNSSFTASNTTTFGTSTYSAFKFDQIMAVLNPQLLYNVYNQNSFKLYLALGVAGNFSAYSNRQDYVTSSSLGGTTTTRTVTDDLLGFYVGGTGKVGIVLNNKIDIYAGYALPSTIVGGTAYTVQSQSYHVGVNLLFGGK